MFEVEEENEIVNYETLSVIFKGGEEIADYNTFLRLCCADENLPKLVVGKLYTCTGYCRKWNHISYEFDTILFLDEFAGFTAHPFRHYLLGDWRIDGTFIPAVIQGYTLPIYNDYFTTLENKKISLSLLKNKFG